MSKAKYAAAAAPAQGSNSSSFGGSFASGFLLGQLTLSVILFFFIKFFLFGDAPSADTRAAVRAASRRQRTLSHSASLRKKRSSAALAGRHVPAVGTASHAAHSLTADKILDKTYYNVDGHQPESLDWFNVLFAQTIAQLRADAALDDDENGLLSSLTAVINGPSKPDFLDDIRVTEISLGDEFPIFSNCRVIPVDEDGGVVKPSAQGGRKGFNNALRDSRLEARMDVDLSDVVTLGIETKLLLNYPKPFVAALPVALSVSVVRFSGTLSLSFSPSQAPSPPPPSPPAPPSTNPATSRSASATSMPPAQNSSTSAAPPPPASSSSTSSPLPQHSPTTLTFTFLDDYRLDLSVHSLIGSRSRLQDVPKIAQLVEQRLHAWFDERCVEPRFQQIVLPSLWPRKRNARGGDGDGLDADADVEGGGKEGVAALDGTTSAGKVAAVAAPAPGSSRSGKAREPPGGLGEALDDAVLMPPPQSRNISAAAASTSSSSAEGPGGNAARQRPGAVGKRSSYLGKSAGNGIAADEDELALAGAALREAEQRSLARAGGGGGVGARRGI